MKMSKKLITALVAITLCFTVLCCVPAAAVSQTDPAVTAQPTEPTTQPTTQDIGEIVSGIVGDVDPTLGDEIRDTADEAQGILRFFTDLIDKISDFLGDFLNAILGTFFKDKIF